MPHTPLQNINVCLKVWIYLAAALVLCNYYYIYFIPFTQGKAQTETWHLLLKAGGVLSISIALLSPKIRRFVSWEELMLLFFILLATGGFLYKRALLGTGDSMFINTAACLAPFLLLRPKDNPLVIKIFFDSCLIIICIQIIGDIIIYASGASAWDNKAFIGGLGNPSSFGLTCNILVAYVLFEHYITRYSLLSLIILSYGIYMTNSLLSILILCLLIASWTVQRLTIRNLIALAMLGVIMITLSSHLLSDHVIYKMKSLESLVTGSDNDPYQSRSVSLRREIHEQYVENFSENPSLGITVGFLDEAYMKYDSQFLTYFSSFGLLVGCLFFAAATQALLKARHWKLEFPAMCMLIFCVAFTTNRIMDYYPMPIFLVLILSIIRIRISALRRNSSNTYSARTI